MRRLEFKGGPRKKWGRGGGGLPLRDPEGGARQEKRVDVLGSN